jgi:hypothetical protein
VSKHSDEEEDLHDQEEATGRMEGSPDGYEEEIPCGIIKRATQLLNIVRRTITDTKGKISAAGRSEVCNRLDEVQILLLNMYGENCKIKGKLEAINPLIETLKTDVEDIKNNTAPVGPNTASGVSSGVSSGDAMWKINNGEHGIIVKDLKKESSEEDLKAVMNDITSKIRLSEHGIAVKSMRRTRQNHLLILCPTSNDAEILKDIINEKFSEKYIAKKIKKKWPRVVLKDINKEYTREHLYQDMKGQNQYLRETMEKLKDIKIVKEIHTKRDKSAHLLIEVSPDLRRKMLQHGKVNIGYQRLTVAEDDPVIRCYHCLRIGHIAKFCRDKDRPPKCSHCAEEHSYNKCTRKSTTPTCINCQRENLMKGQERRDDHSAMDRKECHYYHFMHKLAKNKYEY